MRLDLIKKIRLMEESEIYEAIYTDRCTGVMNRRAFDSDDGVFTAIVDVDSLKYVNDQFGHRAGDLLLCSVAKSLASVFGNDRVYRLGGDEFAIKGDSAAHLLKGLRRLRFLLPSFSYGVGVGVGAADSQLNKDKDKRLESNERAPRGVAPKWIGAFCRREGIPYARLAST